MGQPESVNTLSTFSNEIFLRTISAQKRSYCVALSGFQVGEVSNAVMHPHSRFNLTVQFIQYVKMPVETDEVS